MPSYESAVELKHASGATTLQLRSPTSTVVRGALALLTAQPLTWGASLLVAVFVPQLLGPDGFGQLAVAQTFAFLAATVASLGVPYYLPRRVATEPEHADLIASGAMIMLLAVAASVAGSLAIILPFAGVSIAEAPVLRLALSGMIGITAQNVIFAVLNGLGRHSSFAWINAVAVVANAGLGVGVLLFIGGAVAYLAALVSINLIVAVIAWRAAGLRYRRESINLRLWRGIATGGLPFLGWELARRIRSDIDVVLVGVLLHAEVAGWLAAAYKIIAIPVFIPTLITTPLLPALSRTVGDVDVFRQTMRRSVVIVLVLTIPISGMIFALAPVMPRMLHWSSSFAPAVPLMMILAFQQPFVALDMVLGTALIALKHERRWMWAMVAAAILNPALNLLIIPLADGQFGNGAIGAACVELGTELVMFTGALMLLPRSTIDRHTVTLSLRVVLAGVGMAGVAVALQAVSLVAAVGCGGMTFAIGLVLLHVVRQSDLHSLKHEARRFVALRSSTAALP